jgi:hypothetical protein
VKLFDHVYATYRPPERECDPRYAQAIGRRALFQVAGVITLEEGKHAGELAFMPRDMRDGTAGLFPPRVPLTHLADVELAPPGAGKVEMGERRYGMGGG